MTFGDIYGVYFGTEYQIENWFGKANAQNQKKKEKKRFSRMAVCERVWRQKARGDEIQSKMSAESKDWDIGNKEEAKKRKQLFEVQKYW